MAIPTPDSLIASVDQPLLDKDAFIANLSAVMGDAEATKNNYRGAGLFSFYVEGRVAQTTTIPIIAELKKAGWQVHQFMGVTGYMPPSWVHDCNNADYDTPDVKGTSQFQWTHVQLSKVPVAV